MDANAKGELGKTIRGLRSYLLENLRNTVQKDYLLDLPDGKKAPLDERHKALRARLEGLGETTHEVVKRAAYTLINRLVVLKLMEGMGLRKQAIVTGGMESRAYRTFRELVPDAPLLDDSEGYALLLETVCQELALELPGLFGRSGAAAALGLVRVRWDVLRETIRRLDDKALQSCWQDDMTLGWVYQYWNDPEREELDANIKAGKKIEHGQIASKTQMFTERYMVDWLLQNSLGPLWLAISQKNGWTAEADAGGEASLLQRLEARRVDWRGRRERGEVGLTELMPIDDDERQWAYYVPQEIPKEAVASAPTTLWDLKLLDPAVGSGHFLVVAFDWLFERHQEECRQRGVAKSDEAIVEQILEANLHGIDLDPRAVQIAAAALWLKAKRVAPKAHPKGMNLVAANLRLGDLAKNDPALVELRQTVYAETKIPAALTDQIVSALKGADWIGSLLKVETAVDDAVKAFEARGGLDLDGEGRTASAGARESVFVLLERFLAKTTSSEDLGLRLRGEQLASGVRLLGMLREGRYDIVVGNPPYQATSKMRDTTYLSKHYPRGKANLYAAFIQRGLELVRTGGQVSLVTLLGWMFIKQFFELRQWILGQHDLRALADLRWCAFELMRHDTVVMFSVQRLPPSDCLSVGLATTPFAERDESNEALQSKRAATLAHVGRNEFRTADLRVVPASPVLYWWGEARFQNYRASPKMKTLFETRFGLRTSDNGRFLRSPWEVRRREIALVSVDEMRPDEMPKRYVPQVMGPAGRAWCENVTDVIDWSHRGLVVCVTLERAYGAYPQSTEYYFRPGVALPKIGQRVTARLIRFRSVVDVGSPCVFTNTASESARLMCLLNSSEIAAILSSFNPTINLQPGDIDRLPVFEIDSAVAISDAVNAAFSAHESHREPSVEFRQPGPSPWRHAQDWAQLAVDRPENTPLPSYTEVLDPEPAPDHVSYALGVALGRFHPDGSGIVDPTRDSLAHALPHGILFLDGSLPPTVDTDSLGHSACRRLDDAWKAHAAAIGSTPNLRDYLRTKFFPLHKSMYENKPIHWPLTSDKKTFVVWVTIHRMDGDTLKHVLADHLVPRLGELDGLLKDALDARATGSAKEKRDADARYGDLKTARDELDRFIVTLGDLSSRGAPPADDKTKKREVDAPYDPDLDDGVMINAAALWPVLEPQPWKDPKKWWKELANAAGKKDYDWSHLAMRYWPTRVDEKCQADPSLGVAHHCFWAYHPERAFAWELRLQDEIGPTFRITEPPYRTHPADPELRRRFIAEHPDQALTAIDKEARRRRRKLKGPIASLTLQDPGLWTTNPGDVYELELALSEAQGAELLILAPDEPDARAAFEQANPNRAKARELMLADLDPIELPLEPGDSTDESDVEAGEEVGDDE